MGVHGMSAGLASTRVEGGWARVLKDMEVGEEAKEQQRPVAMAQRSDHKVQEHARRALMLS